MHGGLPVIGVSVLVYGAVGALVIAREALQRCRLRVRQSGSGGDGRGARACAAASQ